jgi:hypothetical protein
MDFFARIIFTAALECYYVSMNFNNSDEEKFVLKFESGIHLS